MKKVGDLLLIAGLACIAALGISEAKAVDQVEKVLCGKINNLKLSCRGLVEGVPPSTTCGGTGKCSAGKCTKKNRNQSVVERVVEDNFDAQHDIGYDVTDDPKKDKKLKQTVIYCVKMYSCKTDCEVVDQDEVCVRQEPGYGAFTLNKLSNDGDCPPPGPGAGGPGAGDPGAGDPGAGDPGAGDPGAGDPAVANPTAD